MADFAVSTAFTSKDGITRSFKQMGAAANKFGRSTDRAFDQANRRGMTFKKTLAAILSARVISHGSILMQQGIRTVTEEFVTFDDAITQAGAKFPVTAKRGTKAFDELAATARKVGAETKFSATEAAGGLDFLAMAGFNTEQAMAALPRVTDLAVVANTDLARATDIASDALGSFGLMTEDTGQLTKNLSRINDVFARTVTSANTDIEMLFETMKDGGPVITAAGQSVETFAALTGKMADAGIKSSKAGTVLKNMFIRLQAPPTEAAKALKKLRIDAVDPQTGALRDIVDILGEFNRKTAKMGDAQKSAYVSAIFGQRAIAGVNVLLATGSDKLKEYRTMLEGSEGAAKEMAETIGKSLGNRLKALRSAAIEMGFKFVDAFKDKLPGAIDAAVEAVRKVDVKGIIDDLKNFFTTIRDIYNIAKPLLPIIVGIAAAQVAYNTAMKVFMAYNAVKTFMTLAGGITAASAAQTGLNAALWANPIGVVIGAVTGLAVAGYMLYKQWDNIKLLFSFLWEELKGFWRWLTNTKFFELASKAMGFLGAKEVAVAKPLAEKAPGEMTAHDIAFERGRQRRAAREKFRKEVLAEKAEREAMRPKLPGRTTVKGFGRPMVAAALQRQAQAEAAAMAIPPLEAARQAPGAGRTPPNKEDVAAQNINFQGKLEIAGAPPGSKIETKTTGAPPIKTEMAGANV